MYELLEKIRLLEKRMVLWHGSSSDDPRFSIGHTGKNSHTFGDYESTRYGIFLSNNPKFSAIYGKPQKYVIYPQKTINMDDSHDMVQIKNHFLSSDSDVPGDIYNAARYTRNTWEWFEDDLGKYFVDWLRSYGYDSATFVEYLEDGDGKEQKSQTFVMLDPTKIRHDSGKQKDIYDKIYK